MPYLKNEFETWIKSITRNNGEYYSSETINNYINVVKNYCKKLNNLSITNSDLFFVDNISDFESIHSKILNHPDFEQVNQAYHRAFSSGLLIYKRFLQFKETERMKTELSFEQWLVSYQTDSEACFFVDL